jgi:ABC-type transporter Mla subunit MlaD
MGIRVGIVLLAGLAVGIFLLLRAINVNAQESGQGSAQSQEQANASGLSTALDYYRQALRAASTSNDSAVPSLLREAADAASGVDPTLAALLEQLRSSYTATGTLDPDISRRVDMLLNNYNAEYGLDYPTFSIGAGGGGSNPDADYEQGPSEGQSEGQ